MDAYRTAYVYVRETFAGILKETDYGYYFKYDKEYLDKPDSTNVSLTLPKREEEYTSNHLFAFFRAWTTRVSNPVCSPRFRASASVVVQ